MKIAVASDRGQVTQHFGHCQDFKIYWAEEGCITKSETVPNPGHRPGYLPNFLHDLGVKVIISGGMGGGAIDIFREKGISVVTGAQGDADKAAADYARGLLESSGAVCQEHSHHEECEK